MVLSIHVSLSLAIVAWICMSVTPVADAVPVDGNWGQWSAWGDCSTDCGPGTKERRRFCNHPPPTPGGKSCDGSNVETTICEVRPCPIDVCDNSTDTIYGSGGEISSPNYPSSYPQNANCHLIIQVGKRNLIHITIVEYEFDRWNDYLEIRDGPNKYARHLITLRGTGNKTYIQSTGNTVYLRFYSDGYDQNKGFEASFYEIVNNCAMSQFRCASSGQCIPESYKCNGVYDCFDGSDEQYCNKTTGYPDYTTYPTASPQPSQCKDLKETCVEWVYNGYCTNPEYQTYMTVYCRKSCNMCTGASAAMNNQGDPCIPVPCYKRRNVCGSDNITYRNDCELINARKCGKKVVMIKHWGSCNQGSTPSYTVHPYSTWWK